MMTKHTFTKIKSFLIREPNSSILKAQLKLFYLMLGANVFKGFLYLYDAYDRHQGDGSGRALRLIITSVLLMGALRLFPRYIKFGIHWAVFGTILHLYYRIFNDDIGTDTIAMQAIVMVIISAFYGLNARWGLFYSVVACAAPILSHYIAFRWTGLEPLPENLNDCYIAINFVVILLSHVYFHNVLFGSLKEKDVLNDALAETADAKGTFLSTMAHELRTPLNSVIGIASLLIEDNENEKQKEQLDILKFSAENLLSLINDILDINKLAAGKLELESVSFNCFTLIKSVSTSTAAQAKGKALDFKVEVDQQIQTRIYLGDATRMTQILFNLVGNAVKFTQSGGIIVSAKLLSTIAEVDLIRFQVADTGIGISEKQQRTIFEPFVQASSSTNRKFGGSGLGLSIVKQLVEMFGSSINLESQAGKGTTIYFDLALKHAVIEESTGIKTESSVEVSLSTLNLLLVEDNMMNIYFMKELFRRWEIVADIAENGKEALDLVTKKLYDVVLMDMQMPIMDGIEATKRIRQLADPDKAATYIIALTASVSDEVRARVKESGMNDYLQKPFQLEELHVRLVKLVAAS
ncbi:ATP-binding protein [Pedobacter metabolipauper]|uniref:histidine kinase n=1 Tax=Pedobacter metabolipauper TaxID=425513 RepID=A0A4R6SWX6_9SPHI|nr:ATP-binding protein [Pedobacter metabolipauper]TDQ08662.1 signal transduction histidine kinase [Pedobacter metabolipauper]